MNVYVGTIIAFAGNYAPGTDWALCQGQTLNITDYPDLFGVIGNTYGGDGITTFCLPDFRSRKLVTAGQGMNVSQYVLAHIGGKENQSLAMRNIPAHGHSLSVQLPVNNSGVNANDPSGAYFGKPATNIYDSAATTGVTIANPISSMGLTSGGTSAFDIREPYVALNYCIALKGTVATTWHPITNAFVNSVIAGGGSLTNTQANILDRLVRDLKGEANPFYITYNVWSKFNAIYPIIGGTAITHKLNLVDPRDADAAFRLTFYNSPTHDANGITWNGTSQYADTHLSPNTSLNNICHMGCYINQTPIGAHNVTEMGSLDSSSSSLMLSTRYGDGKMYADMFSDSTKLSQTVPDAGGLYIISNTDGNTGKAYVNGAGMPATVNIGSTTRPTRNIYMGASNQATGTTGYSARRFAFASIGAGLSAAENTALYNSVQAYQSSLGRQI